MDDLSKILPNLPSWVAVPIVFVTVLLTLGPQLIKMLDSLATWSRTYRREKERLSLLKLRYEIEAIKKTNGLQDLDESISAVSKRDPVPEAISRPLPLWQRFMFGALGSTVPTLVRWAFSLASAGQDTHYFPIINAGYVAGVVLLALLGGGGASFLRKTSQPLLCFLTGLSLVLLLQGSVVTSSGPRVRENISSLSYAEKRLTLASTGRHRCAAPRG